MPHPTKTGPGFRFQLGLALGAALRRDSEACSARHRGQSRSYNLHFDTAELAPLIFGAVLPGAWGKRDGNLHAV